MDLSQHPFITGGGQLPFLVCCARRCRLAGADRLRDVRGGVPDQVGLRVRRAPPQRAENRAHAPGRRPVLITPALQNLDVAFQGRQARGMIGSATVARFASCGWGCTQAAAA